MLGWRPRTPYHLHSAAASSAFSTLTTTRAGGEEEDEDETVVVSSVVAFGASSYTYAVDSENRRASLYPGMVGGPRLLATPLQAVRFMVVLKRCVQMAHPLAPVRPDPPNSGQIMSWKVYFMQQGNVWSLRRHLLPFAVPKHGLVGVQGFAQAAQQVSGGHGKADQGPDQHHRYTQGHVTCGLSVHQG